MAVCVSSPPASAYVAVTVITDALADGRADAPSDSVGAPLDTVTWAVSVSHRPVVVADLERRREGGVVGGGEAGLGRDALVERDAGWRRPQRTSTIVPSTSVDPVPSSTRSIGGVASSP